MAGEIDKPRVLPIDNEEKLAILECWDRKFTMTEIAASFGRSLSAVSRLIHRYHPTTNLATRHIRASALKLAERIVKKADVDQAIEILSRPNIGVLEPINKGESSPGVMISVNQGDLGAVQITAGSQQNGSSKQLGEGEREADTGARRPGDALGKWNGRRLLGAGEEAGSQEATGGSQTVEGVGPGQPLLEGSGEAFAGRDGAQQPPRNVARRRGKPPVGSLIAQPPADTSNVIQFREDQ